MIRLSSWMVDGLARLLEPGERDAVCGDLAESGESDSQALIDLLGLVIRRHALFVCLAVPLGLLLNLLSRRMADGTAVYIWLYANNWDWNLLENAAFQHDFPRYIAIILTLYLALFCVAWVTGVALGFVSRRRLRIHGFLVGLTLFFGGILGAPPGNPANAAVFDLAFYRVFFPLVVQAVLVLFPCVLGMRHYSKENPT